jgi:hypothetical protein
VREVEVDHETVQTLVRLLGDHPELNFSRLGPRVEAGGNGSRRPQSEPMEPKSVSEIAAPIDRKVITRAEARRFMRLRLAKEVREWV